MSIDITNWLRGLGLEQYATAFLANDIDAEVLPELTADDLIGLGVTSIGHRRKLLAAIATLRDGGSPFSGAPVPSTEPVRQGGDAGIGASSAERRQLTVMFCDLVGSTALASRLDPEDLREVSASYRAAVADVVAGFGGYVAKYMGDGVLAYFGYPQAHEHDAEQAVRAGLALIDRVGQLESGGTALASRVGIATGLVVVGDLIGSGEAQERGVVGETPNLAARLQEMAPRECGAGRRKHAAAGWRSLRLPRSRGCHDQGTNRAGIGLAGARREHDRKPLRGPAFGNVEPARRSRRGSPTAAATVGPGQERRRPDRAGFR